jgi:hypothetical protein
MSRPRKSFISTVLIALTLAAGASGAASARTIYDGAWSVVVTAASGPCSGAYRYPVAIVNGSVRHLDPYDQSFNIYGRIGSRGRVRVSVSRGEQRADGVGQLSRYTGGGIWRSPNGCAGSWVAERRG